MIHTTWVNLFYLRSHRGLCAVARRAPGRVRVVAPVVWHARVAAGALHAGQAVALARRVVALLGALARAVALAAVLEDDGVAEEPVLAALARVPRRVVEAAGAVAAHAVAGRRRGVVHVVVAHARLAEFACNDRK